MHSIAILLLLLASSALGFTRVQAITLRRSLASRGGYSNPNEQTADSSSQSHLNNNNKFNYAYQGVPIFESASSHDQYNAQTPEPTPLPATPNHNNNHYNNNNNVNNKKLPLFSFRRLTRYTETFFKHFIQMVSNDPDVVRLISNFLSYAFWTYLCLSILGTIGFDTKPFLSLVSVTGITIGFAAKDILTNSFSGIFILFTRPFQRGSIITVDKYRGKVISMDVRYVRLQSLTDKTETLVPLSMVYKSAITIEKPATST